MQVTGQEYKIGGAPGWALLGRPVMYDKGRKTTVWTLPDCNYPGCGEKARYDAASWDGRWGFWCERHWRTMTPQRLGLGLGQELVLKKDGGGGDERQL